MGTAGQRCTSTRRLIVHQSVYDVKNGLKQAWATKIGNPDENNHMGPLIDKAAVAQYTQAQQAVEEQESMGGKGNVCSGEGFESGCYVQPSIAEIDADAAMATKPLSTYHMKVG